MHLPAPLTIAWVSNLPELQNAYLESPTPLMWWVCCGNKSGLYHGGDQELGRTGEMLGMLSSLSPRAGTWL